MLDSPALVMHTLQEIETDLAHRQNDLEEAARAWFLAKRDKEKEWAGAFLSAGNGTVADRKALADLGTNHVGCEEEAEYEAQRAVIRVLETRAAIGMSLLKAQSR